MTLTQLKCLCEVVDQGLNLSRAAAALHTSQPAVTKMVRALEGELGLTLLVRSGPRIVGVTDQAREVIGLARRVLQDVDNLRLVAGDALETPRGALRIGTTHLHARYALVDVVRELVRDYPQVELSLFEGTPSQVADWTRAGEVDVGIATAPDKVPRELVKLDAYPIHRCIIAPEGHPILRNKRPTLSDLGQYRLVAYDRRFRTGRIEGAFESAGIVPRIAMRATDADIIKTYVSAGLGVAVIQEMAFDPSVDTAIRKLNADHLFLVSRAYMLLRRDRHVNRYLQNLIERLTQGAIDSRPEPTAPQQALHRVGSSSKSGV